MFRLLKELLPKQMNAIVYYALVHIFLTSVDTRLDFGRRDALGRGPDCSALWDKVLMEECVIEEPVTAHRQSGKALRYISDMIRGLYSRSRRRVSIRFIGRISTNW